MKVLHVLPSLSRAWGGPVSVVEGLVPALVANGVDCTVLAAGNHRDTSDTVPISNTPTSIFPQSSAGRIWAAHSPPASRWINQHIRKFDLIHIHELWHYLHFTTSRAALRYDIPYIVTPHGELGEWEMSQKRLKKRIYMALTQRRSLERAGAIQALTNAEATTILNHVAGVPVRVIPNGVSPNNTEGDDASRIEVVFRQCEPGPKILFLGRLHYKKGVDLLPSIMERVLKTHPNGTLLIAGPDQGGSRLKLERQFANSSVKSGNYRFVGLLNSAEARTALRLSDIYVQPSRSEGFSMSALEAMLEGVPSVITKGCNFDEIQSSGAGRVVETSPPQVAQALIDILDDSSLAKSMSENARKLAENYSWDSVSRQIADLYESACS